MDKGFHCGTDALLLASFVLKNFPKGNVFLELGCGEGLSSIILAQNLPSVKGFAIDFQENALLNAKKHLDLYKGSVGNRLEFIFLDLSKRKEFVSKSKELGFKDINCALANPPYHKYGKDRVSKGIQKQLAKHQNSQTMKDFCLAAKLALKHHGYFFCIYAARYLNELLWALEQYKFGIRSILPIHSRPNSPAQWVLVKSRKDAASDIEIEPSFCLYENEVGEKFHPKALEFCPWL